MTRDEAFQKLQQILSDNFEIDPEKITLDSNIYSDLELDSIDAVDLVIHVQELIGKKIGADEFKTARTVNDVLDVVEKLQAAQ
ncbi:MAG: acyl carrier protein [Pseudomonadales bacterium]